MSTVTLVEINSPVSLRTCGSSISSLVHRRTRLQCFSPDKRAAALKARTPDVRDRVSVTPKVFGLEGTQLVSSPAESPDPPRPCVTPYSGRQSRYPCDELSASESLDDFTDEELDVGLDVETEDIDDKRQLCVQGSRQKLYGPYDVPNLKVLEKKSSQDTGTKQNDGESDREGAISPDNPPPSPINFWPSLDGFVVGGQKLACPAKTTTSQDVWSSNSRDFKPGFVKYPLYHCNKCADRVLEEEQTEVALQRRRSCLLNSRMSTHRLHDDTLQGVGSRLGRDSQILMGPLRGTSPGFVYPDSHNYYDKTFLEIYMKKKKEKEERDREMEEERRRQLDRISHGDKGTRRSRPSRSYTTGNRSGKVIDMTSHPGPSDDYLVMCGENDSKTSSNVEDSDITLNIKRSSSQPVQMPQPRFKPRCKSPEDVCQSPEMDLELELRCCKSDIYPFPEDVDFTRQNEDDLFSYDLSNFRSRTRITPMYPLVRSSATNTSQTTCQNNESTNQGGHRNEQPFPPEVDYTGRGHPPTDEHDYTMTATVIVPSSDLPCDQWVSFTPDNEPVLNTSPDVEEGCDTFLKRLQRTKLCNTDALLPTGQQFCYEAVVDKRYNRWKRRRRRKKEGELRRAVRPEETESSDDNEGRNAEVENILDEMYDQIHGPPPLTPNGSRDTPRLRNRRRRTEITERKNDVTVTTSDPAVANYDASSECTSSDNRDNGHPSSSNSGLGQSNSALWQCSDTMVNTSLLERSAEARPSEEGCYWPQLEEYKEQILNTIQNTPQDELEEMDQKYWLPDITLHLNGSVSRASQRSGHDGIDLTTPTPPSPPLSSDECAPKSPTPDERTTGPATKDGKDTSNMYTKWCKSKQQQSRNSFSSTTSSKLLSRTGASTWSEMGSRQTLETGANQKGARPIGVVTMGENTLDSTFEASIGPINRDEEDSSCKIKNVKQHVRDQPKVKVPGLNLPALTKNMKSQTFPQNSRREGSLKAKKKPQNPGRPAGIKPQLQRPKTQPLSVKTGSHADPVDSNLIFRDYYLKTLYNERMKLNPHVGPGKKLKKTITVDQLDIGGRKTRTDDDKLSDLAFTRSFTFSMFDLPEVYKMYNSNLVHKASGEVVDISD